mgnify:CR=1 FL=1
MTMRKVVLSALFVTASALALNAQKISDVQKKISENKYTEAKADVDKLLATEKGQKDANTWYYKAIVYNRLAKDSTVDNSAYRMEALDAYKKYQEMDTKNVMGTLEQNVTLFDIYSDYFNSSIKQHNSKQYDKALASYRGALAAQQYINQKNLEYNGQKLPALDTALTMYAGSAAYLAGDTAQGVEYFKMLADAKVGGKDYMDIHQVLVDYYNRKGDAANRDKYTAIGKELYPDNDYWTYFELYDPALKEDKKKMFAKYEELIARNPNQDVLALDYAIELFNYTYAQDKPSDYAAMQTKLEGAIQKAISAKSSGEANFLMMQHLSNKIYDLQETSRTLAKSTKPEDVKKRTALTAEINKISDQSIQYAEAAEKAFAQKTDMKLVDKANYKSILNQLANYYKGKKQPEKAKVYEDKLAALG